MTPCYTIHDLIELTGYSLSQIRRYTTTGVLSRPLPSQNGERAVRYSKLHIDELRRIREIQEQNMTLVDIRDRLHPVDDDDEEDWG